MAAKKTKDAQPAQPDPSLQRAEGTIEPEPLKERLSEATEPLRERLEKPVARVTGIAKWVQSLRPYRVYINFSHSDGNLRAAGMGYQSLFAVFAAIWVAFSAAGIWLTSNTEVFEALAGLINRAVPGLIAVDGQPGVIEPSQLDSAAPFGWTGIIAAIGLLWTAIGWLYYTRQAVRAVFGLSRDTTNYALQKIRDLGLALLFGVVLLFSALLTIVSTEALTFFLDVLGLSDSYWTSLVTRVSGLVVSVILNIVTLGVMFRVLARVSIPWRNLFFGSLLGSAALAGLSALAGLFLGGATRNPLLATFAVFVGLLIWFNFVSRVILLAASWIAVGMFDRGLSPRVVSPEQQAAEKAAAEYDARVLVARAELDDAKAELASARWYSKLIAQRSVERAQHRLNDILDEGLVGGSR
ncbi:YihY/virulence factor BrkB family protein [Leifsonia sp. NPDC058248]|uniref:YihY/virulence factor BrkB family protein n=1 Tax=Leifsonia sp. NPDC058248 TaxID=3346402 RepID=UPI0036D88BE8